LNRFGDSFGSDSLKKNKILGLAGYPLSHSFSPAFFGEKFLKSGLSDWEYRLLESPDPGMLRKWVRAEDGWVGFNVTIPHKKAVFQLLDSCDPLAFRIGAVNVVKIMPDSSWRGYNSDYFGFLHSLLQWQAFSFWEGKKALVFGSGGSSLAVRAVLEDLGISFKLVSRIPDGLNSVLSYSELRADHMLAADLLIQTTPVGMHPGSEGILPLPEEGFFSGQFVFDLIYNPAKTRTLALAENRGALIQNGLAMLHAQAEKAWEIWNYG
jgi:shikimate dehydrogenase